MTLARRFFKVGRFLVAGLPGAALAIPLNYVLVERAGWAKPSAYAGVLVVQVMVNFFACRYFVFSPTARSPLHVQFTKFVAGILLFRLADWALYSALVGFFGSWYLLLQVINAAIFALAKFRFSERVMEGPR